ncbi:MAG: hypothetical protein HY731_11790, partial [Candidatus Tectomicrobia bacterium]|nr:hypothetical protein [Candidatus Tectomicrobia bacterium]
EYVDVDQIGVRLNKWGGGVVPYDFGNGIHFGISGIHEWKFLDKTLQFLDFSSEPDAESKTLEIRTEDNNIAYIDVSIPYRIKEGGGHKIIEGGLELSYRDRMRSTATSILRVELARMSSIELQSTDIRQETSEKALPLLNKTLEQFHLAAEKILIRGVQFNPEYEGKLQDKQYFTQLARLNTAKKDEQEAIQETDTIEKQIVAAEKKKIEEWNKRIQEKTSEYQILLANIDAATLTYDKRVRADGDAERIIRDAEGRLALEKAEALKTTLESQALNTIGGKLFVALEAAKRLNIEEILVNANAEDPFEVLNIHKLTEKLGTGRSRDGLNSVPASRIPR